jgi:ribosomal protein L34E
MKKQSFRPRSKAPLFLDLSCLIHPICDGGVLSHDDMKKSYEKKIKKLHDCCCCGNRMAPVRVGRKLKIEFVVEQGHRCNLSMKCVMSSTPLPRPIYFAVQEYLGSRQQRHNARSEPCRLAVIIRCSYYLLLIGCSCSCRLRPHGYESIYWPSLTARLKPRYGERRCAKTDPGLSHTVCTATMKAQFSS